MLKKGESDHDTDLRLLKQLKGFGLALESGTERPAQWSRH